MKPLATETMQLIQQKVREGLKSGAHPVAAFDADGTLWKCDMGENFFQYKINHKLVALPDDPWAEYARLKDESHPKAYLWLAQILADKPIHEVREWARAALTQFGPAAPIFPWMKDLIQFLKAEGVKVHIVTASITWAVEPAAHLMGIAPEDVIGIETYVRAGKVTTEQKGPITYREGKVDGLLARTGGRHPVLAAGNTLGDLALLESASHVQLVNVSDTHEGHNYGTEQELLAIGKLRGWLTHEAQL
jgi:phosphoserine phosphatase